MTERLCYILHARLEPGFWTRNLATLITLACAIGAAATYLGLLASFHLGLPAGPGGLIHTWRRPPTSRAEGLPALVSAPYAD